MKDTNPIKRLPELQMASREHHQSLLLCWKIRNGLKRGVKENQIQAYVEWFFHEYIISHFEYEERYMFPILPFQHPQIQRALKEHKLLYELILSKLNDAEKLTTFANLLDDHIRFEERLLFNLIQNQATPEQLEKMETFHKMKPFEENTALQFI